MCSHLCVLIIITATSLVSFCPRALFGVSYRDHSVYSKTCVLYAGGVFCCMRCFSQSLRFVDVSENFLNTWKHLRTSFLTTLKKIQNMTFQLLQARVAHFLQLCTFAFGCPNKENTKSTEHVGNKCSKMSKATTCLRAF